MQVFLLFFKEDEVVCGGVGVVVYVGCAVACSTRGRPKRMARVRLFGGAPRRRITEGNGRGYRSTIYSRFALALTKKGRMLEERRS